MRVPWFVAIVGGAGLLATAACFEDSAVVDDEPCSPGEQRSCGCAGDPEGGTQVCVEDGSGFGPCSCPTTAGTTVDPTGSDPTGDPGSGAGTAMTTTAVDTTAGTTSSPSTTDATSDTTDTTAGRDAVITLFSLEASDAAFLAGARFRRPVADMRCSEAVPPGLTCSTVHALLCIDAADTIASFEGLFEPPPGIAVVGPTGIPVAPDWSTLVANPTTLDNSLVMAQVAPVNPWTGCDIDGNVAANCGGWTLGDSEAIGDVGDILAADASWKSEAGDDPCNQPRSTLCACWGT